MNQSSREPIIAWSIIVFTMLMLLVVFVASILTIIDKVIDIQDKLGWP